jgi:hypothetical protein
MPTMSTTPTVSRRLAVGLTTALLTTGLAAAPAVAEDLPTPGSTGITAPNGWTPEGSVAAWSEMGLSLLDMARYQPAAAASTAVTYPSIVVGSGAAPWIPWCGPFAGIDSPREGCR